LNWFLRPSNNPPCNRECPSSSRKHQKQPRLSCSTRCSETRCNRCGRLWPHHSAMDARSSAARQYQSARLALAEISWRRTHSVGDCARRMTTGVTTMQIDAGLDTGNILLQQKFQSRPTTLRRRSRRSWQRLERTSPSARCGVCNPEQFIPANKTTLKLHSHPFSRKKMDALIFLIRLRKFSTDYEASSRGPVHTRSSAARSANMAGSAFDRSLRLSELKLKASPFRWMRPGHLNRNRRTSTGRQKADFRR